VKKASLSYRRQQSSAKQEHRIAVAMGGKRVVGSGNQPGLHGDVKAPGWLIEAKQTKTQAFRLTLPLLRKIEVEAMRTGDRLPAMIIEMSGRSYAVLRLDDFLALKDRVDE
jgi:hypothetical protein